LSPDAAYAALLAALWKASYRPPECVETTVIDEAAALCAGTIRYLVDTGHLVARRVRIVTVKDGLLFRSAPMDNEADAWSLSGRRGQTLGF